MPIPVRFEKMIQAVAVRPFFKRESVYIKAVSAPSGGFAAVIFVGNDLVKFRKFVRKIVECGHFHDALHVHDGDGIRRNISIIYFSRRRIFEGVLIGKIQNDRKR